MTGLTRRRFITISAAAGAGVAAAMRVAAGAGAAAAAGAPVARWRGVTMGAGASMTLDGVSSTDAAPVFAALERELARLERIFSLFRADSAISRLNRDGVLNDPPAEMLDLLSLCATLNEATGGAFDPTVQPAWAAHARAIRSGGLPGADTLADVRARIGWEKLRFDASRVVLTRPGMGLTLNGVAQGFVADRVAAMLRGLGLDNVLVNMGEIRALGARRDGRPWRVGISAPDAAIGAKDPIRTVRLAGRALATSAPMGTVLDAGGKVGHIFDPRTARPAHAWQLVSVSAPRAALADGLSTAFCLMDRGSVEAALGRLPAAKLELLGA